MPKSILCWDIVFIRTKYDNILLYTNRSKILLKEGNSEIEQQFVSCSVIPFLKTGRILANSYNIC